MANKEEKDALENDLQKAKTLEVFTQKNLVKRGKLFISLYKTLLGNNAQVKWTPIVATQIVASPWTDL